jgi:geranylgeranyl pyrophosphate synthase
VRLSFETREEAVRYAEENGIAFQLFDDKPAKRIIKAYADNFAFGRKIPWTH